MTDVGIGEALSPSLVGEGGGVALTKDLCFSRMELNTPEYIQRFCMQGQATMCTT